MIVLSGTLETDLVTTRTVNRIRRETNRFVAHDQVLKKFLPTRFSTRLKFELPHVYRERSYEYNKFKRRRYGHQIPNVLTGRLKAEMPDTAKVTATSGGGAVYLRAHWAGRATPRRGGGIKKRGMPDWQRAEFETLSKRETDRLAKAMERKFVEEISKPENRRKRRVRGG